MPRYCFTSAIRPERIKEYRRSHTAVWPEMLEALRDAGWRNYSLFLAGDGTLVGTFEADDYEAAQAAMERTEVNARWQAAMEQYFVNPGNPDEGFALLEEIFHLEDQLRAAELPSRA